MNSKFFYLLLFISILTGCGVKSDPVKYPEIAVDSYINEYTGKGPTAEQLEKAKKDKESSETIKPLIPSPQP